jgi:hypothetical protein
MRSRGHGREIELLPAGYDSETRTFTAPEFEYSIDWPLERALDWLATTFGTFPYFEEGELFKRRSFAAVVAAMVGTYCVNMLPDATVRPLVLIDGNQVRLGKSLLVRMINSPVHGKIGEGSKPKSDEELRKMLDATALAGKPYLFLDDLHSLAVERSQPFHVIADPRTASDAHAKSRELSECLAGVRNRKEHQAFRGSRA